MVFFLWDRQTDNRQHRRITLAIRQRDPGAARRLTRQHFFECTSESRL